MAKIGLQIPAYSAERADLASNLANRFGLSPYLLVVDTEAMDFKALANPQLSSRPGVGGQTIVSAINEGVEVVLTGYCGPSAYDQLVLIRYLLIFPILILVIYGVLFVLIPEQALVTLRNSGEVCFNILLPLVLVFVVMLALNLFVKPAQIVHLK